MVCDGRPLLVAQSLEEAESALGLFDALSAEHVRRLQFLKEHGLVLAVERPAGLLADAYGVQVKAAEFAVAGGVFQHKATNVAHLGDGGVHLAHCVQI